MEEKLVVLKLFLDALGVSSDIETVDDRKRVQKAIYMGQLSGVDLGYRFGWYVKGPYSPPLTRDYYQLAEELETDPKSAKAKTFREDVLKKLAAIKPIMTVPSTLSIPQADWLELVASYHYLRRVSKYSHEKALDLLKEQKSHVAKYVDEATSALKHAGLLQSAA